MSTEKMREEFELSFTKRSKARGEVARLDKFDGRYEYLDTSAAWWAWKESRAAIEVQAPDDGIEDCQEQWGEQCKNTFDCGYNFASMRYDQAIESLGLKVKP